MLGIFGKLAKDAKTKFNWMMLPIVSQGGGANNSKKHIHFSKNPKKFPKKLSKISKKEIKKKNFTKIQKITKSLVKILKGT